MTTTFELVGDGAEMAARDLGSQDQSALPMPAAALSWMRGVRHALRPQTPWAGGNR